MFYERGSGPWVFLGIGLAAILVAHTLQGRERQPSARVTDDAHLVAVMGSTQRVSQAQPFYSANMTAVMGHSVLDLRRATLAPGEEAVIDVFALMGSVEIRVPDGWVVDARAIPVFGGIHDQRRRPAFPDAETAAAGPAPRLVLHGLVMMGGMEIK